MEKALEKAIECITKKYADFSGRASRSEFWVFAGLVFIISFVLSLIDMYTGSYNSKIGYGILSGIFAIFVLIPGLAVDVRRLHDINKSGWWLLIALIPIIGAICLLVFYCLKGTEGENRFGADPLQQ